MPVPRATLTHGSSLFGSGVAAAGGLPKGGRSRSAPGSVSTYRSAARTAGRRERPGFGLVLLLLPRSRLQGARWAKPRERPQESCPTVRWPCADRLVGILEEAPSTTLGLLSPTSPVPSSTPPFWPAGYLQQSPRHVDVDVDVTVGVVAVGAPLLRSRYTGPPSVLLDVGP